MRAAMVIAGKDLRRQLGNGTLLLFAVVLPLGLAFLFSTIMGDNIGFRASYAVADADGGELARAFVDDVLGAVAAQESFEVREVGSAQEAVTLAEDGEVGAAFLIPAGFTDAVASGQPATLEVVGNVDATIASQVGRAITEAYATELGAVQLAVAVSAAGGVAVDDDLVARAQAAPAPVALTPDPAAAQRRELDPGTYSAAGMAVFFLFFTAMLSVSSIIEERAGGTMARLMATPTRPGAILAGKLAAGVGVGLVAMTVLVTASTWLFGAQWGDPLGVAVLVAAVALAATGIMALVASFARTTEQATTWMSVLAVVFGLFGGSFVPLAQLGGLATISSATPHRWFLLGLSDLAGGGLDAVVLPALALLGFAAVTFTLLFLRTGRVVRV